MEAVSDMTPALAPTPDMPCLQDSEHQDGWYDDFIGRNGNDVSQQDHPFNPK